MLKSLAIRNIRRIFAITLQKKDIDMEANSIVPNVQLNTIVNDIRNIILNARGKAYATINQNLIHANWEIGRRIVEEEQRGKVRAEYGTQLLRVLSQKITAEFGQGYGVRNLSYFKQLYIYFPDW